MKTLSPAFAAHLASGATTLARCWRLERRDAVVLGFTDHDRDLSFGGVTYLAATGLTASRIDSPLGLAPSDLSVVGVLADESLEEADLAKGLYDDAKVTLFLVNWQDVSQRTILRAGNLGEVRRSAQSFLAEVRGLAHKLDQASGRRYLFGCDADLGDQRCGVDLTDAAFRVTGTVAAPTSENRSFVASGLGAFVGEHFSRGRLLWTSGANAGGAAEVKRHTLSAAVHAIELWLPQGAAISSGDGFTVTAGCDKQYATCAAKFANQARFRGFPHMPGNDWALSHPSGQEPMDGASRYKS
jgi:uncharacterized phage protein (TIGR02218 family)